MYFSNMSIVHNEIKLCKCMDIKQNLSKRFRIFQLCVIVMGFRCTCMEHLEFVLVPASQKSVKLFVTTVVIGCISRRTHLS